MRLSVFDGQYRWHFHPDKDELFLVVAGELCIEFEYGAKIVLRPWQSLVVPAGAVHRTLAVGRTVNVTFERQCAETVFVEPLPSAAHS
jgi:mannose-6-phosphate isomerase-like protein (cupin superfamily)